MTLGNRIKICRKFRGITQQTLGDQLGYLLSSSSPRIAQYEKGKRIPKLETRLKIAELLDISPCALLPFDNIDDADMIFRFMLHGSFYVNKSLNLEKDDRWYEFPKILSAFLDAGLKTLTK